jgi:pilus assembly protein CpaE
VLDVVKNLHRMDRDLLASFVEPHDAGISVLASPALIGPGESVNREQARSVLQFLRRQYEYVVVDLEKSFNALTGAAVETADDVIMVTTPDLVSLRNTKKALAFVERSMSDPKRLRLVVNRRRTVDVITSEDVEEAIGRSVFATLIADEGTIANALNKGTPAVLSRKSHYTRDVKSMAVRLIGSFSTNGKSPPPRKSLFGGRSRKTGKKKKS